jgi:hypothetical protein
MVVYVSTEEEEKNLVLSDDLQERRAKSMTLYALREDTRRG